MASTFEVPGTYQALNKHLENELIAIICIQDYKNSKQTFLNLKFALIQT